MKGAKEGRKEKGDSRDSGKKMVGKRVRKKSQYMFERIGPHTGKV